MLHVSRPVRWDSDHVALKDDETRAVMLEIVRANAEKLIHIGTDYFDASINRIAATALGARNIRKSILDAYLEPTEALRKMEVEGNFTGRLLLLEEIKNLPSGAVWDKLCMEQQVKCGDWIKDYI